MASTAASLPLPVQWRVARQRLKKEREYRDDAAVREKMRLDMKFGGQRDGGNGDGLDQILMRYAVGAAEHEE